MSTQNLRLDRAAEKRAWNEYLEDKKRWVASASGRSAHETPEQKAARKAKLESNYEAWCQYYFPHYVTDEDTGKVIPMGWFHKKLAADVLADPNFFGVAEWPREHAKSVNADIFLPLHLKAKGELSGMVLVGNTKEKAMILLADVQAELAANTRYIADYGPQQTIGDWDSQHFATQDGVGFWALGRGQSPRGIRKAQKRPNYVVIDDFDDEKLVENEDLVQKAIDWLLGGLYGAIATKKGRFLMVGNRIHPKSALAHVVGDVKPGQPKKEGVYHLKVYALENPRTHEADQTAKGVPAWKENYTAAQIRLKMARMGHRIAQREFFHKQIKKGTRFDYEWFTFVKVDYNAYPFAVIYCDPSYKDANSNDFKALVAVAPSGSCRDVLAVWLRQTSSLEMVQAHYNMAKELEGLGIPQVLNYVEGGFIQPEFLKHYQAEGKRRNYQLMVHIDKRKKPDKLGRIDDLRPGFQLGEFRFASHLVGTVDYQSFEEQLLEFPNAHDDGPDAMEGAIRICNRKIDLGDEPVESGGSRRTSKRPY